MGWSSMGSSTRISVLLDLLGGPKYVAGLKAASSATWGLSRATLASGRAMRTASRNTWIQNQALYTFRRYAFFGTLAVTALAVGVAKLGYEYLATRDSARAALRPIFKDTQTLNAELDRLFILSKYSPFVLKDMTDALRVMYPSLHGAGLGIKDMNELLLSMTNILSQSGRTTPKALSQISYAIQHMLYQGRLTGRLTQSLAAAGVPVPELLARLGYAHANLSSIARLNIAPQNVIRALTEMGQAGIFKDAARRVALRSLPGMFQVLKDSLSQLIGTMAEGPYNRFKANMRELVGPGGFLDKLSTAGNASQVIMMLSQSLTGSGAAGKGLLMLLDTLRQITRIMVTGVIPAFAIALAILLPLGVVLWPLNFALHQLADHIWLVKYALVPLAAYFILTHTLMLSMFLTSRLLMIATFGYGKSLIKLSAILFTTAGRMKLMLALKRLYIILTKGEIVFTNFYGKAVVTQYTRMELAALKLRASFVRMAAVARASWLSMLGPIGLMIGALLLYIHYQDQISNLSGGGGAIKPIGGKRDPSAPGTILGVPLPHFSLRHPLGDWFGSENKSRKLSAKAVNPIDPAAFTQGDNGTTVHQLVVDRKVLAEAVAREGQDRQARR